jgi:hypothetical protein
MANTAYRSRTQPERELKGAGTRTQAQAEAEDALIDAGRHIADDAADMTRRSAETMQQTFQSSIEMAAQVTERSIDQLATVAGVPTRQTEQAAQQSSRSLQAIFDSGAALMDAVQKVNQDWLDRANSRQQQRLDACAELLRCQNPTDAVAVQLELARRQVESLIEGSRRASELVGKAAGEALRKIKVE